MTATEQFNRIVSMVAELTRRESDGGDAVTIRAIGELHGVSDAVVNEDIRTLTVLGDRADADWLLSLRIWQRGDQVSISSAGPFRRPIRMSPEEQLAIQLALALDAEGAPLAARFASFWSRQIPTPASTPGTEDPVTLVRRAVRENIALEIDYAGQSDRELRSRVIEPHQVAESGVRTYIVAWATDTGAWRHFRLDRIVAVRMTHSHFKPRTDFEPMVEPRDAFRPSGATERVTIRFRAGVAPWVTEFYGGAPGHELQSDGSVLVQFDASSTEWLVRRVLEFGGDAEVVEPASFRDAVRRAVA